MFKFRKQSSDDEQVNFSAPLVNTVLLRETNHAGKAQ